MNKEFLLSIIIPVYNSESVLERCLNSIVGQTHREIEIILIDDGSEDSSPQICDKWSAQDGRIRSIHLRNRGASAARNAGMSEATGAYLTFVDADDELINQDIYKSVIEFMNNSNADVTVFGWEIYSEKSGLLESVSPGQSKTVSAKEMAEVVIRDNQLYGGGYPWNKVWRADKLKCNGSFQFFYDTELFAYEDKLFVLQNLFRVKKAAIFDEIGYRYYINEISLSHNEEKKEFIYQNGILAYEKIMDFYKHTDRDLLKNAKEQWATLVLYRVNMARKAKNLSFARWLKKKMPHSGRIILLSPKFGIKLKILCFINMLYVNLRVKEKVHKRW